mgnify:CR=1 FL=1
MTLAVPASRSSVGIHQKTSAGGAFDGTLAPGNATFANGLNKYADAATGGLFNFEQDAPLTIMQYHFDLGASVVYTISIVNLDANGAPISGEELQIDTGTGRYPFTRSPFILLVRQALKIVVAGVGVRQGQVVATIIKQ